MARAVTSGDAASDDAALAADEALGATVCAVLDAVGASPTPQNAS